jgi:hypothetical protein
MFEISKLNIDKSIATKRVVYKKGALESINENVILIYIIPLAIISAILFWKDVQESKKLTVLVFTCALIFIFCIYSIYRIFAGSKLGSINTGFSKEDNIKLLLQFAESYNYEIIYKSKSLVILNEENEISWNNTWSKKIILISEDDTVYYNIKKDYPKFNPPIFFSHLILKRDIKNYFKKRDSLDV